MIEKILRRFASEPRALAVSALEKWYADSEPHAYYWTCRPAQIQTMCEQIEQYGTKIDRLYILRVQRRLHATMLRENALAQVAETAGKVLMGEKFPAPVGTSYGPFSNAASAIAAQQAAQNVLAYKDTAWFAVYLHLICIMPPDCGRL